MSWSFPHFVWRSDKGKPCSENHPHIVYAGATLITSEGYASVVDYVPPSTNRQMRCVLSRQVSQIELRLNLAKLAYMTTHQSLLRSCPHHKGRKLAMLSAWLICLADRVTIIKRLSQAGITPLTSWKQQVVRLFYMSVRSCRASLCTIQNGRLGV